jgi:hypothetical protein
MLPLALLLLPPTLLALLVLLLVIKIKSKVLILDCIPVLPVDPFHIVMILSIYFINLSLELPWIHRVQFAWPVSIGLLWSVAGSDVSRPLF